MRTGKKKLFNNAFIDRIASTVMVLRKLFEFLLKRTQQAKCKEKTHTNTHTTKMIDGRLCTLLRWLGVGRG